VLGEHARSTIVQRPPSSTKAGAPTQEVVHHATIVTMTDDGNAPTIPDTQAPTQGPSSTPKPPDARYTLRALLGKGGMGEVWLAHDTRIDRDIAIKLMRGGKDADAVARFFREARVQGRLEHPSVVPVHDLGDDSSPFFAMKRLSGTTLADVIAARDVAKWPRRTLLARFVEICLALEFAHQRGVIHRDLKPANIMLGDFGESYVLDWGLARIADGSDSDVIRNSDLRGDSDVGHTEAGAMLGTPGYMAPEQMRGELVDQRTDVYALGCILFEILTGEPAIPRDRTFELTLSALCHRPLDRSPDAPPELDELVARATQADPAKRIGSARELADGVQRFLDGDRDLERRRQLAADHAARAHQLLAKQDNHARAEAMREAGSAIALDAGNQEAKQVLARLLLDPPTETPPQVRAEIEHERQTAARAVVRTSVWVYLAFSLLLPVVYMLGVSKVWPLLVVAGECLAIVGFCVAALRFGWHIGPRLGFMMLCLHCTLLATIGVLLGPLLLLPILLFGTAGIFATVTSIDMPKSIVIVHLLALVIPLSLEWLGIVPASYTLLGNALVLQPWAIDLEPTALVVIVLSAVVMQLFANAFIFGAQRNIQARAQEQLHIQKWQLEQLVPSSGSSSA
jgi:serine/threonine-protein kinase